METQPSFLIKEEPPQHPILKEMNDYYAEMKSELGFDSAHAKPEADPSSLDEVMNELKENSKPTNFMQFMTTKNIQNKPAPWKKLVRRVMSNSIPTSAAVT